MNNDIRTLEPKALWTNFYQITQIPRPSYHEERIQNYIYNFGKNLGLETIKDEAGNVIIRKPATPGMEDCKGVVFQGHLDMVPQKNRDKVHDFENDPIEAYIDGEWVTANGTTLGADNGIGVSTALTILASTDIPHGPLEALFTATEETGMDGANGLKPGLLKGEILLNMDSETEGELYVGCAGGEDITAEFTYSEETVPAGSVAFKLNITGMKGGHSGMEINLGRGNANKVFFRILKKAHKNFGIRLASVEGGNMRNAIPREVFSLITVSTAHAGALKTLIAELSATTKSELAATEPGMKIELSETGLPSALIDEKTQINLTHAVMSCPNGVIRMSDNVEGLVETSNNLAIVKSDAESKAIKVGCLMRSSVDSAKEYLGSCIESAFAAAGAKVTFDGAYPGWKPNMESPILKTMEKVYENKYGKTPEIKAIHAGLECAILGGTYPNWDMISFGPTISSPHSPDEKVNIASVQKFWNFTLEVLKNIPKK